MLGRGTQSHGRSLGSPPPGHTPPSRHPVHRVSDAEVRRRNRIDQGGFAFRSASWVGAGFTHSAERAPSRPLGHFCATQLGEVTSSATWAVQWVYATSAYALEKNIMSDMAIFPMRARAVVRLRAHRSSRSRDSQACAGTLHATWHVGSSAVETRMSLPRLRECRVRGLEQSKHGGGQNRHGGLLYWNCRCKTHIDIIAKRPDCSSALPYGYPDSSYTEPPSMAGEDTTCILFAATAGKLRYLDGTPALHTLSIHLVAFPLRAFAGTGQHLVESSRRGMGYPSFVTTALHNRASYPTRFGGSNNAC